MSRAAFFLIINTIASVIYSAYWFKKNKEEVIYRLTVTLLLPFAGLAYFIIVDIFSKKDSEYKINQGTLHGIDKDVKRSGYVKVDFQKEVNVIPLEEALIINSGNIKRKLIVDTFKEDVDKYIGYLKKALSDEDTETSHYAAATIMEVRRRLAIALQEIAVRYESNREDMETARLYAEILERYLDSGFLDSRTYAKYMSIYSGVLNNILDTDTSEEKYFIDKINCEIQTEDYVSANEYCHRFHKNHTNSEMPYVMHMKLFYILRDYKKFNKVISLLKRSDIRFSNTTLNIIRFWSGVNR